MASLRRVNLNSTTSMQVHMNTHQHNLGTYCNISDIVQNGLSCSKLSNRLSKLQNMVLLMRTLTNEIEAR